MTNRTLAIIKPDAVNNGYSGLIIDRIIKEKFKILGVKILKLSLKQAERFYAVHKGKEFFTELTAFMSSGACIVMALKRDNAVEAWRKVIGDTNPMNADHGTIRNMYAKNVGENAVHGSDGDKTAALEIAFFFDEASLIV
ncbi:MAG: nucleoside-diphosphate kinase [Candidatus Neomarinimicrobiota bacterium]